MKIVLLVCLLLAGKLTGAQPVYNKPLLDSLQLLRQGNSPARHFAALYYQAVEITNKRLALQPDSVKNFVCGFEAAFGPIFLHARQDNTGDTNAWKYYYADTAYNLLQYQFIGMNVHINGDMWLALKGRYNYDTLKKYKRPLLKFQRALNTFFDSMYVTTRKFRKLQSLHYLTLGLDKPLGRLIIYHWRKKQVQLAMLYYRNPCKWRRKLTQSQRRIRRWNRFVAKWIT